MNSSSSSLSLSFYLTFLQIFKQTQKYGKVHTCTHSNTAPFRTRAYTDIKEPLFCHSYRYTTGRLCCEHICVWVLWAQVYVCVYKHNAWSALWQTPSAHRCDCHTGLSSCVVCFCLSVVLFMCEQLKDNSSSTNKARRNWTILPLTVFVCGSADRKWDHAEGSGCVRTKLIKKQSQTRSWIWITY